MVNNAGVSDGGLGTLTLSLTAMCDNLIIIVKLNRYL
jgi:hypothetical protein